MGSSSSWLGLAMRRGRATPWRGRAGWEEQSTWDMRDLIKIIFDFQGEWSCWLPTWRTWQPGRRTKRATAIAADLHHTTQVQMLLSLFLIVSRFLFETSRVSFSLKGLLSCGSLTLTYVHFPADSRSLFATTQSSQFHLRWSLFKTI